MKPIVRRVLPWLAVLGAVGLTAECRDPDPASGATLETNPLLPATPVWTHDEIEAIINEAASHFDTDTEWLAGILRRTAWRESRYDPRAYNRACGCHGLFQFTFRTWGWMSDRAGLWGLTPYDPSAAAYTAAWAISNGHQSHWKTAY